MTLVVDASALVEFVLGSSRGRDAAMLMSRHDGGLHAPGLIMAESLGALRALERRTSLTAPRVDQAVDDLLAVPLHKYGTEALVARIWSLRGHITVYDAHYVALAEALEAPLLTGDHRLASATGELIEVITV
ncbi:type II toxin-antitoxin system VapC family toxin [Nakamurella sp. GG22]